MGSLKKLLQGVKFRTMRAKLMNCAVDYREIGGSTTTNTEMNENGSLMNPWNKTFALSHGCVGGMQKQTMTRKKVTWRWPVVVHKSEHCG